MSRITSFGDTTVLAIFGGASDSWMKATNDPLLHGPVKAPAGAKVNPVDGISPKESVVDANARSYRICLLLITVLCSLPMAGQRCAENSRRFLEDQRIRRSRLVFYRRLPFRSQYVMAFNPGDIPRRQYPFGLLAGEPKEIELSGLRPDADTSTG
jgi:hypothetical protein